MKKIFSAASILLLIVLLQGCGGSGSEGQVDEPLPGGSGDTPPDPIVPPDSGGSGSGGSGDIPPPDPIDPPDPGDIVVLWVDKQNPEATDNGNNCLSEALPCSSIGHAVNLANAPRMTVKIKAGIYIGAYSGCKYFEHTGMACLAGSGSVGNPIIIQAAEGHEGQVILDGQRDINTGAIGNFGINIGKFDHIVIKGLELRNMNSVGIASSGDRVNNVDPDTVNFSVGVQILNNYIHDVYAVGSGKNPGGIRMDGADGWEVKNNSIHTVCGGLEGCRYINAGCIYSYVVLNATIENNLCHNSGAAVHWKDHVVDINGNPTIFGSLVRYNLGYDLHHGFDISHGDANPESSNHIVTNNIFYNIDSACIALITDTADGAISLNYVIEHNTCNRADVGIFSLSSQVKSSKGNIFSNITGYPSTTNADIYRFSNVANNKLDGSNYNVFIPDFPRTNMSNPNTTNIYHNLLEWQQVTPASNLSINVTNPDMQSIEASQDDIFIDAENNNYKLRQGTAAIEMVPCEDENTQLIFCHAGAYQYGNEVIGLYADWPNY